MQAVNANILGSENVLEAAAANNVQKVVVLSTDKAVGHQEYRHITKADLLKLSNDEVLFFDIKG